MMMLKVRNLTRTPSGGYRYRRVVPADCRHEVGRREWLKSFGDLPEDVAAAKASALNAEYDALVRSLRAGRAASERMAEPCEQAAMDALDLSSPAEFDALMTVSSLLKELTRGDGGGGARGQIAALKRDNAGKRVAAHTVAEPSVSAVYAEDKRLYGTERRDEKVVGIAVAALVAAVGDMPFRDLTHEHVLKLRAFLMEKGNQPATINRRMGPLKAMWNRWARRAGDVNRANPFVGSSVKVSKARDAKLPFHRSHLEIIANASFPLATEAQLAVMWTTGVGPAELAGLEPEDVILDHEIPHIWVRSNERRALKTGETRERRIPLLGAAQSLVERALIKSYSTHTPLALSAKLNKALRAAGLPHSPRLTCYSFRHTLKAALRESNAPSFITDRIMGHAGERGAGALYGASKARLEAKRAALGAAHAVLGQVDMSIFRASEVCQDDLG